jgi:hypothetical protein
MIFTGIGTLNQHKEYALQNDMIEKKSTLQELGSTRLSGGGLFGTYKN